MLDSAPPNSVCRTDCSPVASLDATRSIDHGIRAVLSTCVADAAEIVWVDRRREQVSLHLDERPSSQRETTVEVRVLQGGRLGAHRLGRAGRSEMEAAARLATAHAAASDTRIPGFRSQPNEVPPILGFDRRLSTLDASAAEETLQRHCGRDEAARMRWCDGQVVLRNSEGLRLAQRVTSFELEIRSGQGPGAGYARDAARRLCDVEFGELFERARRRRAGVGNNCPINNCAPKGPCALTLAPEATADLIELLNQGAFASQSFLDGTSFLREHLGVQVFDRRLTLLDDGLDAGGLVFPFDLEGMVKSRVLLVADGVPKTPALDGVTARACGMEPTGHGLSPGVGCGLNLFMKPGRPAECDLLEAADGGLWVSRLDALECFDPSRMRFRGRARGVRRIHSGRLAAALPDLVWEDSLLRIFGSLEEIGRTTARRLSPDGILGGISAPAVAVQAIDQLRPAA